MTDCLPLNEASWGIDSLECLTNPTMDHGPGNSPPFHDPTLQCGIELCGSDFLVEQAMTEDALNLDWKIFCQGAEDPLILFDSIERLPEQTSCATGPSVLHGSMNSNPTPPVVLECMLSPLDSFTPDMDRSMEGSYKAIGRKDLTADLRSALAKAIGDSNIPDNENTPLSHSGLSSNLKPSHSNIIQFAPAPNVDALEGPVSMSSIPSERSSPTTSDSGGTTANKGRRMNPRKRMKAEGVSRSVSVSNSSDGDEEATAKKLQRLMRNRASATESRMRRKAYVSELEGKCRALEAQLNSLRQLASVTAMENGILRDQLSRMHCSLDPAGAGHGSMDPVPFGVTFPSTTCTLGAANVMPLGGELNVEPSLEPCENGGNMGVIAEPAVLESDSLPLESLPHLCQLSQKGHSVVDLLQFLSLLCIGICLLHVSLFPLFALLIHLAPKGMLGRERGRHSKMITLDVEGVLPTDWGSSLDSSETLSPSSWKVSMACHWKLVLSWMPRNSFDCIIVARV